MITNLHIKNIGIIEDIELNLGKGLNVLTGETGAGKTLILNALGIISGGRFSKEMIRKGETNSFIEVCIYEPESEFAIDGNIIISREINSNGRNMCKINGRMATVNELKEFMAQFIEIHGQNDNQNLLDIKEHKKYLDGYIGLPIEKLKNKYNDYYTKYNNIKKELKENFGDEKEKQRKIDLLNYQINEIDMANLKIGEEEELEEKRKLIMNVEKIEQNLNDANMEISENTIDCISNAIKNFEKIETIDEKYKNTTNSLKNIYYELQEISRDISEYHAEMDFDEQERNEIEERLDTIYALKRKYGNSICEILEYNEQIKQEMNKIENLEEHNQKLKRDLETVTKEMNNISLDINKIRGEKAIELANKINENLRQLEMKNAKINVHVDYQDEFYEDGKDKVEIYITTNLGEGEKELNKVASGGEMSRVMLAIKSVLANTDETPILVFDEIDSGISGKAANSVAEKLNKISEKHQVLCISHLPTIAAHADCNYFISKQIKGERTRTSVKQLDEKEVIAEIARISSGEVNEVTLKYANELRNKKTMKYAS